MMRGETHPLLIPLRWERMLVNLFTDCAKSFGFMHVGIIPAQENEYYGERYLEGHSRYDSIEQHQHRMLRRYNGTAKKCKFKFDEKSQLFIKEFQHSTI